MAPTPPADFLPNGADPYPNNLNLQNDIAKKAIKDNNGVSIKQQN